MSETPQPNVEILEAEAAALAVRKIQETITETLEQVPKDEDFSNGWYKHEVSPGISAQNAVARAKDYEQSIGHELSVSTARRERIVASSEVRPWGTETFPGTHQLGVEVTSIKLQSIGKNGLPVSSRIVRQEVDKRTGASKFVELAPDSQGKLVKSDTPEAGFVELAKLFSSEKEKREAEGVDPADVSKTARALTKLGLRK